MNHTNATHNFVKCVLGLHASGRTAEEIATQLLDTEPETALFRAKMLIEIFLDYARDDKERMTAA